ncbi:hypothetical protein [Cellvibrio sp.]|uniref:hypothetical protein n=1 Tax=Cellvibrio sp. TaxID=1965322 RepID=UPI0039648B33
MSANNSIILVMLVSIKSGQESVFADFAKQNAPLLQQYQIQPVKSIAVKMKGQIVGQNEIPQPDFITLFSISSMEQFMAYMADFRYAKISALRAQSTTSVIGYFTYEQNIPAQFISESPAADRLYMVGLANFKNQDAEGLEKFNKAAIENGLFSKHGMHIEYQLVPFKVATVVGDTTAVIPERIQVFFIDKAESFREYVSDPVYKNLSPLRDNTLTKYDFFAGGIKP